VLRRKNQSFEGPNRPERNEDKEAFVLEYRPVAGRLLDLQILTEQTLMMRLHVIALRVLLLSGFVRQGAGSPDLAVGMRIARAHHRATILENLYVADEIVFSEIGELLPPHLDDSNDFRLRHSGKGQIMPRRKTSHTTDSAFCLRD